MTSKAMPSYCHFPFHLSFSISVAVMFLLSAVPPNGTSHAASAATSTNKRAPVIIDLIHRDSPRSPLYNASLTLAERRAQEARRSHDRARYIAQLLSQQPTTEPVKPTLNHVFGSYMVDVAIGTPSTHLFFIVDTGSPLTWTQCKPCGDGCYLQFQPMYDPSQSSSYIEYPCPSFMCIPVMYKFPVGCVADKCHFQVTYLDGSGASGHLGSETLTFDATSFEDVPFGCVSEAKGFDPSVGGMLGLSNANMGFAHTLEVGRKFATCLTLYNEYLATGRLVIGDAGGGAGMVSTPLVDPDQQFYKVTITGAFIGDNVWLESSFVAVVDSGTTNTYLPGKFVESLEGLVHDVIQLPRVPSPDLLLSEYCYLVPLGQPKPVLPHLVFTFAGPVNVTLPPETAFRWLTDKIVCLTIMSADKIGVDPIWGAATMGNFLVGYDINANVINFTPTNCNQY